MRRSIGQSSAYIALLFKAGLPRRRTAVLRRSALVQLPPGLPVDQRGFRGRPCPVTLGSRRYGAICFDRSWLTTATAANYRRLQSIPRSDAELADRLLRNRRSVVNQRRGAVGSHQILNLSIVPIFDGGRQLAVCGCRCDLRARGTQRCHHVGRQQPLVVSSRRDQTGDAERNGRSQRRIRGNQEMHRLRR